MTRSLCSDLSSQHRFVLGLTLFSMLAAPLAAAYGQSGGTSKASKPRILTRSDFRAASDHKTETAIRAEEALDTTIHLDSIIVELSKLPHFLEEELDEVAVFLDSRTLEIADVEPSTQINLVLKPMPLRSALRTILRPHGLRIDVIEEGLAIKPDFEVLTRRGIETDRWLRSPQSVTEIVERLSQVISIDAVDEPLSELASALSETSGIPIVIARRALEEIGLSHEEPVTISLKNITFRSALRLLLRNLDLTYMIGDEVMQITTIEAAEQNLRGRIYFLEGTGASSEDCGDMVKLITATIVPDTWEVLGGPSSAIPYLPERNRRPAVVVSTTSDVHDQIADMLKALRESNID